MQFKLQETDQGQFEIIQTKPVVVGVFPDHSVAKKVFDFLVDDYMDDMPATAPKEEAPIELALVDDKPPEEAFQPQPKPPVVQPKTVAKKPAKLSTGPANSPAKASNVEPLPWTEGELEAAMPRLLAGEKIKDVAASYNKSWVALRAKWAAYKRFNKTPLAKVLTPAEINDADRDECRLCGKTFLPTADNLDLCARCNRDT